MSDVRAPLKNHRVVATRPGGPGVLQIVEEDVPDPAPGEVRLHVLAAGVSAFDRMITSGRFPGFPKMPLTPGEDVVGLVEVLGEGVSNLSVGQLVAGAMILRSHGGYSEYVCMPATELVPVPDGVDPAEAVCVVINYLTAHMVMHRVAKVQPGERILVHGAAGGVGSALLDLGKLVGLEMYGTASRHNHEIVASYGAIPIDYRAEDFVERIRKETGEGVDVVFDPIGGTRHMWRSNRALRRGGRLVWFGMAATARHGLKAIPLTLLTRFAMKLIPDGKSAPPAKDLGKERDWYLATLGELLGLLAADQLQPAIAARIPLLEASLAHEMLERGGYAGKIVLVT